MSTSLDVRTDETHLVPSSDDRMVAAIERVAMDPTVPIERLKEMLAMKERMEDRALEAADRLAKKAFFAAMSKCQAELPVVVKNQKNDHTKSTYADLAAIEQQAMPIIHKHGFAVSFQPDGYNELGELRILWEISHEDGHVRSGDAGIPVDAAGSQGKVNKTGTQAFGSTATYGRRYLLCMLFNISTGDDRDGNRTDDDATITNQQRDELQNLVDELGWNVPDYCAWLGIDALTHLQAKFFAREKQRLETKIRMKGSAQ
ncbi:ERF family protein [Mesorhizobium australicum]|uniref:ERF family protein n=1 Tax=Mesorhizobium australicum TaxID=536018 RepID=UPI00333CCAB2